MLPSLLSSPLPWLAAVALSACSATERTPAGGGVAASSTVATTTREASDTASLATLADRARIRGDSTAKVWVVIVSDFQCPFCRQWHDEVFPSIVREYVETGRVRLAYVNLPLRNHQNALPAAEAAMCAGAQGRFWEMHDAIFRTMGRWAGMKEPRTTFDSLAASVGVAPAPYRSCVDTHATRALIAADARRVTEAGVAATPTFFVGNERIEGAAGLPAFRAAVERALASAGSAR